MWSQVERETCLHGSEARGGFPERLAHSHAFHIFTFAWFYFSEINPSSAMWGRKGSETLDCWEWNIGTFLFISDAWPNFNEEIWGNMGQYKAILWGQLSGTKRVKYLLVDKKLAHSSNQRCATQLLTTGSLNSCLLIRTSLLLSSHVPTALDQSSY